MGLGLGYYPNEAIYLYHPKIDFRTVDLLRFLVPKIFFDGARSRNRLNLAFKIAGFLEGDQLN